jgi:hypothetical protein
MMTRVTVEDGQRVVVASLEISPPPCDASLLHNRRKGLIGSVRARFDNACIVADIDEPAHRAMFFYSELRPAPTEHSAA